MELNATFLSGFGCGICFGLSILAFKKFIGPAQETAKSITKAFSSKHEYKLVLVVRTDLGMGKGKMAAQCAHAAVGAFEKAQVKDPVGLKKWQYTGQAKIALKIDSEEELKEIASKAKKMGIITSMIRDAGRTQVAPLSITVLGVGPAPKDVIDQVTGHLKLM